MTENISLIILFKNSPEAKFKNNATKCSCGNKLTILKTYFKKMATFEVGKFTAHITELQCNKCMKRYSSDELFKLVPHGSKFGFDIIVFIGKALFLDSLGEKQVQQKLIQHNIPISIREVGYLGKKFIIYLALAHKQCQERIKQLMALRGGYILHLDGTCESNSSHLMSALDSITDIIIDNVKLPSENSKLIIPFLEKIKKAYGIPIATVSDMGKGILKALKTVFPNAKTYICHFHFLKDIGKDLFDAEYAILRKELSKNGIRSQLRKKLKTLTDEIDADVILKEYREKYLKQQLTDMNNIKLPIAVATYFWIHWILNWKIELDGYGFPFDRDYLIFYQRMKEVSKIIKTLSDEVKNDSTIFQLNSILNLILNAQDLNKTVTILEEKIKIFDQLRDALQIALPEGTKGLNDDGNDVKMKTLKEKVTAFCNSTEIKNTTKSNDQYRKMLNQIYKYWDKLFADSIEIINSKGEKILIQPQRTNNILERLFRTIKRAFREKSGNKVLKRTLNSLLSDTPLVQNLQNAEYMEILLNGHSSLEECFVEINIELVRQEFKKINEEENKIRIPIKRILKTKNFPAKIANVTKIIRAER